MSRQATAGRRLSHETLPIVNLTDTTQIMESDDVVVRQVAGEAVLLHLVSERYYVLDAPTTRMWEVIVASRTFAEAVATLGSEFDVEVEVLRDDLTVFIGELVEAGLVAIHSPS